MFNSRLLDAPPAVHDAAMANRQSGGQPARVDVPIVLPLLARTESNPIPRPYGAAVSGEPRTGKRYVIEGNPVSGKNHMQIRKNFKTGGRFVAISNAASSWQHEAIVQLVQQRGRTPTLRGPVYVEYTAYQTADIRDIDNMESALFDALKKALVIEDDRDIIDHRGRKRVDVRPRIELLVESIVI